MKSNNGLTTYKCHMSFINKRILTLLLFFLLLVLVSCIYLLIAYWVEMPIMLKLFGIIIIPIAILGVFMTPLNGMFVTNKYVIFIPDIRIKRVTIEKLKKISFILNERENGKFSVIVKIICIDGKTFVKDYSSQFANVRKKKFNNQQTHAHFDEIVAYCFVCRTAIMPAFRNYVALWTPLPICRTQQLFSGDFRINRFSVAKGKESNF